MTTKVIYVDTAKPEYLILMASKDPDPRMKRFLEDTFVTSFTKLSRLYITNELIIDAETKETSWAVITEEEVLARPDLYTIVTEF